MWEALAIGHCIPEKPPQRLLSAECAQGPTLPSCEFFDYSLAPNWPQGYCTDQSVAKSMASAFTSERLLSPHMQPSHHPFGGVDLLLPRMSQFSTTKAKLPLCPPHLRRGQPGSL